MCEAAGESDSGRSADQACDSGLCLRGKAFQRLPESTGHRASFQPRLEQISSSYCFSQSLEYDAWLSPTSSPGRRGPYSAVTLHQQRCVSPVLKAASDTLELLTTVLHKFLSFSAPTRQQAAAWLNKEVVVSHQTLSPAIPASLGKLPQALSNARGVQPSRWGKITCRRPQASW